MDVSWQKWSKNDYSLKLLGRPCCFPYTNCRSNCPLEIQLLKSIVSRSRAVEVLNPTCQSSLALQLLPCWLPSPPTSICPENKNRNLFHSKIAWKLDDAIGKMLMSFDVTWESHWHGFNLDLKILLLWIPIHVTSIQYPSRVQPRSHDGHLLNKNRCMTVPSKITALTHVKSLHNCILQLHLASEDIVLAIYHP